MSGSSSGNRRLRVSILLILIGSLTLAGVLAAEAWMAGAHVTPEQQLSHQLAVRHPGTPSHRHDHSAVHHPGDAAAAHGVPTPALVAQHTSSSAPLVSLWHAVLVGAILLTLPGSRRLPHRACARLTSYVDAVGLPPPRRFVTARAGAVPGRVA
jgi:hypothetical protein